MKHLPALILFAFLLFSCKKENDDFVWERTYGKGTALFIKATPDSGIISCGQVGGKPYLLRLATDKSKLVEYSNDGPGFLSSAWCDTSRIIAAGSLNGKMLILCIGRKGNIIWDTTITSSYKVDIANLVYTGSGEFSALGSARADTAITGPTGLLFLNFDSTGNFSFRKDITDANFLAANDMSADSRGNLYLTVNRKSGSAKMKASVAGFSGSFQKLWETELYNNPDFGASSVTVINDVAGNVYVAGKTELTQQSGTVDNSFLASLTSAGTIVWKKYLEPYNTGSALMATTNELVLLNRNCFFISKADPDDGNVFSRYNIFSSCDQKTTDSFGTGIDTDYRGDMLLTGTRGGSYFIAVKSLK